MNTFYLIKLNVIKKCYKFFLLKWSLKNESILHNKKMNNYKANDGIAIKTNTKEGVIVHNTSIWVPWIKA